MTNNIKSRSQHPAYSIKRLNVPDNKVCWNTYYENYIENRPYYEHPAVTNNYLIKDKDKVWAEEHIKDTLINIHLRERITNINGYPQTLKDAGIQFDQYNIPINPAGRTGLWGPGLLGKNGPNQAADPIITRWSTFEYNNIKKSFKNFKYNNIFTSLLKILKEILLLFPHLEMIAIQRKDTKDWAIPGGMVETGETISKTLQRELNEEACNNMDPNKACIELDKMFNNQKGNIIYIGYVDDPRNTDSRWMETTAVHYHCSQKLAKAIKLEAGDDAQKVAWLPMTSLDSRYRNLYASHKKMTDKTILHIFLKFINRLI